MLRLHFPSLCCNFVAAASWSFHGLRRGQELKILRQASRCTIQTDQLSKITLFNPDNHTLISEMKPDLNVILPMDWHMDILSWPLQMEIEDHKKTLARHGFTVQDPFVKEVTDVWTRESFLNNKWKEVVGKKDEKIREQGKEIERLKAEIVMLKSQVRQIQASGNSNQTAEDLVP